MYSRHVTARQVQLTSDRQIELQRARKQREWGLEYHSEAQIQHAISHLESIYDRESGQLTRPLRQDEQQFISNERRICKLDYAYWSGRYCNPPDAPIWMADLSFKSLGDIKVGDVVMGWAKPDDTGIPAKWWRHRYVPATVVATQRRQAPLIEVTFASGRVLRCTPDHRWSNGGTNRSGSHKAKATPWITAHVGGKLRHVIDIPEVLTSEQVHLAAWLGGIFDGEGSANTQSVVISQSPTHNPEVSAAIGHALTALGFTYTRGAMAFVITGGLRARARFMRLCRPVRAFKIGAILGRQVETQSDAIVNIREIAPGEVVSMQTTTGNYVAHGYLSKNCYIVDWRQQRSRFVPNVAQSIIREIWGEMEEAGNAIWMQQLKARRLGVSTETEIAVQHRFQFWEHTSAVVAAATPGNSVALAKMMKYAYDNQPWWLVPRATKVLNDMPAEFGEIHSALSIQAGNQFTGVARGGTPNTIHLTELCLAPNTLIHLADGQLKPISDVVEGDVVITHTGVRTVVKQRWRSKRCNELTTDLWLWGAFAPLSTTRDHPVWTPEGWQAASTLQSGSWVRHPVRAVQERRSTFTYVRRSSGQRFQQKQSTTTEPLSRAWGWLFGLYLAEGTLQVNGRIADPALQRAAVVFAGDKDETAKRIERLGQALGDDQHIGVRTSKTSRTHVLYVANAGLARYIYAEFGEKDSKRIPDWAWEAGDDFCLGLVEGYLDGDGHYVPDSNDVTVSSVRVGLLIQLRDLLASLGFGWSSITYKSAGVYFERNCRAQWTLHASGSTGNNLRAGVVRPSGGACGSPLHWHWAEDHTAIDIEVYRVDEGFSETFYDLEVAHPDHSFTTAQCAVHNCEWMDAELLVDAALMRAVIDHPLIFGIMESTALGTGNWWHQTWLRHKREFAEGRARVRPVFLPWYVGTDIYPSPAALQARPIPADWTPDDRTINHAERARQYVLSDPLLFKYLAKSDRRWKMPKAQMWYYELEYSNAKKAKELNLFLGEMASDDFSCFQSTNVPVIDQEILLNYHERTREPIGVFTILGPEIPEALTAPRRLWDPTMPPIPIDLAELTPKFPLKFQLVPLLFHGYPSFDPQGKLLIWEFPDEDHTYGIGADTSGGTGQDNAVMEVLREATMERPPGQVAEFVHDRMTSFQLWPLCLAISAYYSMYSMRVGRRVQSRAAIECMGTGEVVQHEMQKRGWTNFHPWKRYDDKIIRSDGDVRKIGIYTNSWFRPQMLDMVITCLDEEAIDVPSPYLIQELTTLEREPGMQKVKAAYGAHDDRVMGIGFPLYSLHMGKSPAKQHVRQRVAWVDGGDPTIPTVHPTWGAPAYAQSRSFAEPQQVIPASHGGGLVRFINRHMPEGFR